jgi:hypothetical protein
MKFFNKSSRYYLSGIDWVMAGLDQINKTHTGIGNHCALVLVLDGILDKISFTKILKTALSNTSFVKGKTRRAWHLAPYWAPSSYTFDKGDIGFFDLGKKDPKNIDATIQTIAGTPFKDDETLLGFDLVHGNEQTYIIMRFDHRLFDGRGAESFLDYILDVSKQNLPYQLPSQGPQLHSWKDLFFSGQCINRFLRSLYSQTIKVACLDQGSNPVNPHRFYHTTFSEEKTLAIDTNAMENAGYLMNGVFFLSCVTKGFDALLKEPGNILIPINVDMRGAKFNAKVFFNHLSFMIFKVESGLEIKEYIDLLKKQFLDQTKNKIPHHFINASLLMRILPLKALAFFMNLQSKTKPSSFSFSYIGNQAFNLTHVQNIEVINLFHIPIVPVTPGVGVFFTRFNKKLNMIISGFDNTLSSKDGQDLQEKIISGLRGKV